MTFAAMKLKLLGLGYNIRRNAKDSGGKRWSYCVFPDNSAGTTNYFHFQSQIERWIAGVELIRKYQEE